ncbi:MAG TPA: hypothetical protein VL463_18245 [Kofleriaceae bacterium]|nr:hypothetical protein [Kofleriaceae bacterium]
MNAADEVIVSWDHHFDPTSDGKFLAQAYDADAQGIAVDYRPGDQLVFKYTGESATKPSAYVPNGDGARKEGRDPNITLPK